MPQKGNYIIQFGNLPIGKHEIIFKLDNSFFGQFEHSEIEKGDFKAMVHLQKQDTMLILDFEISGKAKMDCDRCGEEFALPLKGKQSLIVKLDGEDVDDSDEIVSLTSSSNEIDISQYLYECIILSLPLRRTHPGKTGKNACNPETLKRLEQISIHADEQKAIKDPRWDALKNIHLS
jgi:uncharacterized protein